MNLPKLSRALSDLSQVTTALYQLTKTINDLITSCLFHNYSIISTQELIKILKTYKANKGIISSLDVENLFTNVPVLETIDTIINDIYHHRTLPPLKINLTQNAFTLHYVPFYDPKRYFQ